MSYVPTSARQMTSRATSAGRSQLEFHTKDSKPSWKRWGSGTNDGDFTREYDGSLAVRIRETSDNGVSREVFVNLSQDTVEKLKALLAEPTPEVKL